MQQLDDAVVVLDGGRQDDLLRLALHLEQLLVHLGQPQARPLGVPPGPDGLDALQVVQLDRLQKERIEEGRVDQVEVGLGDVEVVEEDADEVLVAAVQGVLEALDWKCETYLLLKEGKTSTSFVKFMQIYLGSKLGIL